MAEFQGDLIIEPYKMERIETFEIIQEVNEHARMAFSGVLKEFGEDNPIHTTTPNVQVEARSNNPEVGILFRGIVEEIRLRHVQGTYYIDVEAVSHTIVMDLDYKRASFQDKDMTVSQLVKGITKGYPDGDVIDTASKGGAIGQPLLQYDETDWGFLKRMASKSHTGLVPYMKQGRAQLFFGLPVGEERGGLEQYDFTMTKDITGYLRMKKNSDPAWMDIDGMCFEVEGRGFFDIGDQIVFQGKTLYVKKAITRLGKAEIMNTYSLTTRRGCGQPDLYNDKIIGLSLQGKVLAVESDKVKLHLCIDKSQDTGTAWWFPYATIYAAGGDTGVYFMPEIGDTVFAYFPTREAVEAVGLQSIRTKEGEGDKISDPSVKYIRTKEGKELKLAPGEIMLTGLDGQIFIRLNDKTGVEIQSTKPVRIRTAEDLSINAGKGIYLTAAEEVAMTCRSSSIKLDGDVSIQGKEIRNN